MFSQQVAEGVVAEAGGAAVEAEEEDEEETETMVIVELGLKARRLCLEMTMKEKQWRRTSRKQVGF